jgi:thiamine pyrophosphate-dependent acetolactate synthase large subunit-like protein
MTCYLGNPEVDFVGLAKSFAIEGVRVDKPGKLANAIARARDVTAEGGPFLIDARIMQLGVAANQNWHPDISIAGKRRTRV